jgi:hypothetical protein
MRKIPYPALTLLALVLSSPAPGAEAGGSGDAWWAYRELVRPAVPQVKGSAWVRNPIDAFILSKLEARGLAPAPPAPKAALLRRISYDLTGLPPSPEEVDAFLADDSPDAYERLVERLLASPRHGEKWGRHWLDLVRYAETNGYERDGTKPNAWRFRDYVIRSFNEDKPYDRFVREQIAGDEIEPATADAIIATGYYRLGLWDDEAADPLQARYDELDDILSTTAQAFLATTINCARCHDHKADPVPQEDYYRMLAFFADIPRYGARSASEKHILTDITGLVAPGPGPPARWSGTQAELDALFDRKAAVAREIGEIEAAAIVRMSAEDQRRTEGEERAEVLAAKLHLHLEPAEKKRWDDLKAELERIEKAIEGEREPRREARGRGRRSRDSGRVLALSINNCDPQPPPVHLLVRGSPHAPGKEVEPGFPRALSPAGPATAPTGKGPPPGPRSAGRRRALADWIVSAENPIAPRAIANRLWLHHFGRGLVRTPNDFGKLGEQPTHPDLLDWLASEIIARGWSLKSMHRLIVTSSAYRMSSGDDPAGLAKDPANDAFWRFDPRRLTAEEVRDSVLAVNGSLNLEMGGPSVYTEVPRAVLATSSQPGRAWGQSPPAQRDRRSVYVFMKRSLIEPVLATFDIADPDSSCAARFTTTVPTQALTSLNGDFFTREAARFAERLRREAGGGAAAQVRLALRLALSREPSAREVEENAAFLRSLATEEGSSEAKALDHFSLLVFNLNEFLYLD